VRLTLVASVGISIVALNAAYSGNVGLAIIIFLGALAVQLNRPWARVQKMRRERERLLEQLESDGP
jgi:hypothetical protein